jgi:hypothetical protein
MASLTTYNGLQVLTDDPPETADGGLAIQKNFKKISTKLDTGDPTVNDDQTDGYGVGSRWINTSTQAEFVCTDVSTGAAVWIQVAVLPHPGLIPYSNGGSLYSGFGYSSGANAATPTADTLMAIPIWVPQATTIIKLGVGQNSNGSSGKLYRVGLYTNAGGVPGSKLLDANTLAADTGGNVVKLATVSLAVKAGIYWIAGCTDTNGAVWCCGQQMALWMPVVSGGTGGYKQTATQAPSSALPSTFGSGSFFYAQGVCPFWMWGV